MADGASSLNIVNILILFIIGHDVMTAQQLKEAIDSYGGVRGCRAGQAIERYRGENCSSVL